VPGLSVDLAAVETNIVMVDVAGGRAAAVATRFAEKGVLVVALGAGRIRFVTHHQVGDEDVARALTVAAEAAR
jgi:threonine aldolase